MIKSLVDYAEKNEVEKLRELLNEDIDINVFEEDRTALHSACVTNAIDAARILIAEKIDVNLQDRITNAVPLHYCAVYNYLDMASLILDNGGRLDISDMYGNEPLWTAVFNVKGKPDRLALVELFLKAGADKNHKNNANRSPVDFANQVKFIPLLEVLSEY